MMAGDGHIGASPDYRYAGLWWLIGWSLVALVVGLSLMPDPPEPVEFGYADKLEHLFAYGLMMVWFAQLVERYRQYRWALGLVALGIGLEFVQGWGGYRMFDGLDMLANSAGVLLGWWMARRWLGGSLARVDRLLAGRV